GWSAPWWSCKRRASSLSGASSPWTYDRRDPRYPPGFRRAARGRVRLRGIPRRGRAVRPFRGGTAISRGPAPDRRTARRLRGVAFGGDPADRPGERALGTGAAPREDRSLAAKGGPSFGAHGHRGGRFDAGDGAAVLRRGRCALALSAPGLWGLVPRPDRRRGVSSDLAARSHESPAARSEEHTSELQSRGHLVCR